MPDGVATATVTGACYVPDEAPVGAESMAVGAVRRRLGGPLPASADEITCSHGVKYAPGDRRAALSRRRPGYHSTVCGGGLTVRSSS
jgi:hypothetical protein